MDFFLIPGLFLMEKIITYISKVLFIPTYCRAFYKLNVILKSPVPSQLCSSLWCRIRAARERSNSERVPGLRQDLGVWGGWWGHGIVSVGNADCMAFKLNANQYSRNEPFCSGPEFMLYSHSLLFHIHGEPLAIKPGDSFSYGEEYKLGWRKIRGISCFAIKT